MKNRLKKFGGAVFDYILLTDKLLFLLSISASTLSCLLIASLYPEAISSYRPVITQAITSFAGFILAIILSKIDYHNIARLWKIYAPIGAALCLLIFSPLGGGRQTVEGSDDRAWIYIGSLSFQPSELLKVVFVLTFAFHCYNVQKHINEPKTLLLLLGHGALAIGLIGLQKDFGTMIIFIGIFVCILFAAGINWKVALTGIAISGVGLALFWTFILPGYLKNRFAAVYNLEETKRGLGMQQWNGRITLGSGGIFGKGFDSDHLLTNTPELYNDMMFAHIGQVLGFVGCLGVAIWFCVFCLRVLQNGKHAPDSLGNYICVGVFSVIFFQMIINLGMVLCLSPVVGVTLPLFSAGGSSVISTYLLIGLAASVHNHTPRAKLF